MNEQNVHTMHFDVQKIRKDFPILAQQFYNKPLIYFDNAATTQKPTSVIQAISHYYSTSNANVRRGVHALSMRATEAFEQARIRVSEYINAASTKEIIFTRGTTESINLVAQSYGRTFLKAGDEILISQMEHHANIVPWQMLCEQTGAQLKIIPVNDQGELLVDAMENLLSEKTKLVALVHVSNALGTINPVKKIIALAKKAGCITLIDGAQATPHLSIDVQDLDCDFYAFSGHKMYGPTGIGVLYGKEALLQEMSPYQGGGEMIKMVRFDKTIYNDLPYKFEAGTPHIAGAIGLRAAIDYLENLGLTQIQRYEQKLLTYATEQIKKISGIQLIGIAREKVGILSFIFTQVHAHDVGTILDRQGIAIRTGHHCTMPLMNFFQVPATSRASFAFYNTVEEIDHFMSALTKVQEVFA